MVRDPAGGPRWTEALLEVLGGQRPCWRSYVVRGPAGGPRWSEALLEVLRGQRPCWKS